MLPLSFSPVPHPDPDPIPPPKTLYEHPWKNGLLIQNNRSSEFHSERRSKASERLAFIDKLPTAR